MGLYGTTTAADDRLNIRHFVMIHHPTLQTSALHSLQAFTKEKVCFSWDLQFHITQHVACKNTRINFFILLINLTLGYQFEVAVVKRSEEIKHTAGGLRNKDG